MEWSLLFITIADFTIEDVDDVGTYVLLILMLLWFAVGGHLEVWVWGKAHRRLERRLEKTEQRLRIMEALALRGTDIADRLAPKEESDEEHA